MARRAGGHLGHEFEPFLLAFAAEHVPACEALVLLDLLARRAAFPASTAVSVEELETRSHGDPELGGQFPDSGVVCLPL